MKKGRALLLLLLMYASADAQQKKDSIRFAGSVSVARLSGESQKIFAYQAVVGMRYKKWFAGIGAAYDPYGYRSIPVFLEGRKYIGNKKNWQPLIYGNAGLNFALYSELLPRKISGVDYAKFSPTFYGEAGIGVDKRISRKLKIRLSSGFSYKQFSYFKYNLSNSPGSTQDYSRRYDYYYRRISIRLGLQF